MECNHKIQLKNGALVPCGKCPSCLANLRSEWIFRLKEEYKSSVFSVFVTLTYDEEHVPEDYSVHKEDIQLFHKRLRKHFPNGDLRFYLVSEYGDHTFRPHYHGLYFFRSYYDHLYIYDIFQKSWQNGFISFGEVEEGSIVYCTKYCLKHTFTPSGRLPTFRLMSKMNGGLGSSYLDRMSNYHIINDQFCFVSADGKLNRMPKYYKDQLISRKYGKSGQNPLFIKRQNEKNDIYSKELNSKFLEGFYSWFKNHGEFTEEEAYNYYNQYVCDKSERADSLVLKHCKKQKF